MVGRCWVKKPEVYSKWATMDWKQQRSDKPAGDIMSISLSINENQLLMYYNHKITAMDETTQHMTHEYEQQQQQLVNIGIRGFTS